MNAHEWRRELLTERIRDLNGVEYVHRGASDAVTELLIREAICYVDAGEFERCERVERAQVAAVRRLRGEEFQAAPDANQWIEDLRAGIPRDVHPSARVICGEWCDEMRRAADGGDAAEVARLERLVRDKVANEVAWEEDKERSAADRNYVPRCMRHG